MRVRLIVNSRARRGRESGDAVCAALGARGIECVDPGGPPEDLDAIVVAGGDGTIVSQIADAMAANVPIGVIPLGTFNDMARTLGIPFSVEAACDAIAGGVTRAIDVGRVNDAYFVNEASIGISARVARRQTDEMKRRFGILAILATTLQVVTHIIPFGAIVDFGDERQRLRTIQLTVANSSRFGGIWNVRNTAIDDGWLDLYAVTLGGVRHLRAAYFDITTRRSHRIEADGEPAGSTPARFEVLPAAIRVFVPADRDATAPDRGTL